MAQVSLHPYIFFSGNCREAMEFYKSIFGGGLSSMQSYKEIPGDMPGKDEHPDWIMHSSLEGDVYLMGCDSQKASAKTAKVELSIVSSDEPKLRGYFEGLSDGGKVTQPLEEQFWGDTFGQLTDKFGIDWMINITAGNETK